MKKLMVVLFTLVAANTDAAQVQERPQPLVQIKVRSFDALISNARRITTAVGVGTNVDLGRELTGTLGTPNLAGVDRGKTWQLALALPILAAPPLAYLYVPVTDFEQFRAGLLPTSPLRGVGAPNEMFQSGSYAVIVIRLGQPGAMTPEEKARATAWLPPAAAATAPLLEVALQPDEAARQQALQFVLLGRMGAAQALAAQSLPTGTPVNPQDLAQMINLYLDIGEIVVKGLRRLEVQLDVGASAITIANTVEGVPDSELSRWLKPTGVGVGEIAGLLDSRSMISMAAALGDNPPYLPTVKKLARLSFQMQGQPPDEKLASQIDQLLDQMTPLKIAGSMDLAKGVSFGGFYEFPGTDAKQAYAMIKQFFTNAVPAMTGTNKSYSSAEFKAAVRVVGGVPVDRFTMAMNLDTPMFQVPGQKEMIEQMWSGGKIEMEYAVKGNRLYLATPEKLAELLEAGPRPAAASGLSANTNTVFVGRANVLTLIKQAMAFTPMIPPQMRTSFERINPEGGDVWIRIDLDGRYVERMEVPLKLLETIRELQPRPMN